jgi:hypothetical protein
VLIQIFQFDSGEPISRIWKYVARERVSGGNGDSLQKEGKNQGENALKSFHGFASRNDRPLGLRFLRGVILSANVFEIHRRLGVAHFHSFQMLDHDPGYR